LLSGTCHFNAVSFTASTPLKRHQSIGVVMAQPTS